MRTIWNLAMKDVSLLLTNKMAMFFVIAFPLIMALLFGSVYSGGGSTNAIKVVIVDSDDSERSKRFVAELRESDALEVADTVSLDDAREAVRVGKQTAYIHVLEGFGDGALLFGGGGDETRLHVGIDPSRSAERGYLEGILTQAWFANLQADFQNPQGMRGGVQDTITDLEAATADDPEAGAEAKPEDDTEQRANLLRYMRDLDRFLADVEPATMEQAPQMAGPRMTIESVQRERAGPESAYEVTFPSAVLWALLGCVSAFAVSIVVERQSGTLLRLRTTPISRVQILAGKATAAFLSCMVVSTMLLAFGALVFGVNLSAVPQLLMAIVCCALCFVGLTMIVSVIGKTPEAVGGAGWGIMLVFAMFGGGMIPLFIMPDWMVSVSHFSPVKWGILALEGAIWRGFSVEEMVLPCGILLGVGAASFTVGVWFLGRSET